jgi:ribosome modulation factor
MRPEERVELIEGELIAKAPVGGPHIARVMVLSHLLVGAVGDRAIVSVQVPVRLGEWSEPEPDFALVRPPAQRYAAGLPTSPGHLPADRGGREQPAAGLRGEGRPLCPARHHRVLDRGYRGWRRAPAPRAHGGGLRPGPRGRC